MDIAITKMSSKGQIVIPAEMRKDLKEGEKLVIIKSKGQFIIKKMTKLDKQIAEDIEFAKRTEKAYVKYEKGNFKRLPAKEFLKKLEKW